MTNEQPPPAYDQSNSTERLSRQPPSYASVTQHREKQEAMLTPQYPWSQLPIGTSYSTSVARVGLPVNQGFNVGLAGATRHQSFRQVPVTTTVVRVNVSLWNYSVIKNKKLKVISFFWSWTFIQKKLQYQQSFLLTKCFFARQYFF